ncbi:MAG TPA: hypothetical protein VFC53_14130 [Dehalococcoidia bacterium]|nr:hypothetical protein [Dehalococcoidia bacterium]
MIAWGWKKKGEAEWSGIIQCQACQKWRLHYGIRVKRWFTLFFVPLIPLWSDSKVICAVCRHEQKLPRPEYEEIGREAAARLAEVDAANEQRAAAARAELAG